MDVYVARQPIFDRKRQVYAYELLFRSAAERLEYDGADSFSATVQVIANSLFAIGLENLLGGKKAFLNFDRALLIGGLAAVLPSETLVIEVLESVEPDDQVVAACRSLREQGYTIALDDFTPHPRFDPLVELSGIVKLDLRTTPRDEQERLLRIFSRRGISVLAEKVETQEEFDWALKAGYDYFQGYFFMRPAVVRGHRVPAAKISCLRLLSEIHKADLDLPKIRSIVSQDVSLSYTLLRYANSALFHFRTNIRSIEHALALVGETGIRHWAAISALPLLAKDKPGELVTLSLVRGRFCEHLARVTGYPEPPQAFLTGLFSLLDALVDEPLEEALGRASIHGTIRDALLATSPSGLLYQTLHLVRDYEMADWNSVAALARELNISGETVTEAYAESILWARQTLRATDRRTNTRRNARHPANTALSIVWGDANGKERTVNARLLNVSLSGMQIQVDHKIPVEALVSCDDPRVGISARGPVRYCNFTNGKYRVGVEFAEGAGWRGPLAGADVAGVAAVRS